MGIFRIGIANREGAESLLEIEEGIIVDKLSANAKSLW
jgi:hypothetical protein